MAKRGNAASGKYRIARHQKSVIEPEDVLLDAAVHETGDSVISASRLELPVAARSARLLLFLIAGSLVGLVGYAAYLQLGKGSYYARIAQGNRFRAFPVPAPRGIIYDRFLEPLVENVPTFNVVVTPIDLPRSTEERSSVLEELAGIIRIAPADIQREVRREGDFSPNPILVAQHIERKQALLLETKQNALPGIRIEQSTLRFYPSGAISAHILGYTGIVDSDVLESNPDYAITDEIGKAGIERSYEKILKGRNGERRIERDAAGNNIAETLVREPIPGRGLMLSIDRALQEKLSRVLLREMEKRKARGAAAVALDPRNGKVRALVSLPSYDNNLFVLSAPRSAIEAVLHDPHMPLFNRVLSGLYPPGSAVKPFIAVAALKEHIVKPYQRIMAKAFISVPNEFNSDIVYTFRDWKEHGSITLPEAIAQSSNVYFYTIGGGYNGIKGLGVERIADFLRRFGFGESLGIDLPGEEIDMIPTPQWKKRVKGEGWYIGDTYHLAIGQGDLVVTPIHLAAAFAAIANGGTLYQPQLVERVLAVDGRASESIAPVALENDLASDETFRVVREGMRGAVESGTARGLGTVPVAVAAKTGTAQSGSGEPHSWIATFAPYNDPEIVLVVLLEEGGEGSFGALSVARETLSWYFSTRPDIFGKSRGY